MEQLATYRKTNFAADPYLMDWTAANLPNRQTFFISDLDMIIRDARGKTENLMLLEVKRKKAVVGRCQQSTFSMLHQIINAGLKRLNDTVECKNGIVHRVRYWGFHLLQFEGTTFEDGRVWFDGIQVTEQQLIEILSFKKRQKK